ncbi:MAG: hypothetical protein Q7J72_05400 [Candidatus Omnitrophota bacterium]|nr:hypothetical protein [Candidatus Omnitrophota bacterium]
MCNEDEENVADGFLAQVDFAPPLAGPPKVFRIFGGGGPRPGGLVGAPTAAPSRYCPDYRRDIGIPENPKAALAKIDIRCENRQPHYLHSIF